MKNKWTQISEQWKRFAAEAQKKWGALTDEDLAEVNGSRESLVDMLQKKYRMDKKEANKQANAWVAKLKI